MSPFMKWPFKNYNGDFLSPRDLTTFNHDALVVDNSIGLLTSTCTNHSLWITIFYPDCELWCSKSSKNNWMDSPYSCTGILSNYTFKDHRHINDNSISFCYFEIFSECISKCWNSLLELWYSNIIVFLNKQKYTVLVIGLYTW